ncbi:hypothetical protein ACF08B_38910 [Streptomyces sp. NPDC015139]|uniref:hypothetical protein n=1 Tax=Streptomyces sp. NPDC015139 TaxID=3364942 RepID=UPI0036FFD441
MPTENTTDTTQTTTRLSVNINTDTAAFLKRNKQRGISLTESIRRAIALMELVERETSGGNQVLIRSKNGDMRQLLLF